MSSDRTMKGKMKREEELEGRKHVCRVGYLWLDF